jgi:5'-nucleotidase
MPDTIASYTVGGETYFVTANEGDGREWCNGDESYCFVDEAKIKKLNLDAAIASAYDDENDLKVVTDMGDTDSDGSYEKLYAYGARSFTIWDSDGNRVFDSGDEISEKIAALQPTLFNQDEGEMDGRSGNKGGEPEALAIATIGKKSYAFVGLERQSAIVVYDITDPANAFYVDYLYTEAAGDISPEGMFVISADQSPNGKNLLIVSNEVSGSTAIYEINQ